jgi:membrane fusion protein (multidrug efflux system)
MYTSRNLIVLLQTGVLALSGALFVACSSGTDSSGSQAQKHKNKKPAAGRKHRRNRRAALVEVYTARISPVIYKTTRTGTLTAKSVVKIHNQEEGLIKKLPYHAGDHVKKGDILVQIDDALLRSQLNKASASRRLKHENYRRFLTLSKRKLVSDDQLIKAKTEYQIALAEEKLLQTRVNNTSIKAPFDGVISARNAEPGDAVSKYTHLMTILDPKSLVIRVNISELLIPNYKVGSPAKIRIDALANQVYDGSVARIYPTVDSQTRQGTIEISLTSIPAGAAMGHLCRVTLKSEARESLIVPFKALRRDQKGEFVYIIRKGKARRRTVRSGLRHKRYVDIRSGLKPGTQVVTKGFFNIRAGKPVTIVKADKPDKPGKKNFRPGDKEKSKKFVVQ